MKSQQYEALNIQLYSKTSFQIDRLFEKFSTISISYINFSLNYKNITSELKNNILQLSNSIQITIPDGTYNINLINKTLLSTQYSGFYYKLIYNPSISTYSIYRFNSLSDQQQEINATIQNISPLNQNSLNLKLQNRPNLLEAFKIRSNLFDIHQNFNLSFDISNELIIPISSIPGSWNHYEPNNISFSNQLSKSLSITFELLTLDNQPISFISTDPINIFLLFSN